MNMKSLSLLGAIFIVLFVACSGSMQEKTEAFRNTNRRNLTKLRIGMELDTVLAIMGNNSYVLKGEWRGLLYGGHEKMEVSNPHRVETFTGGDKTLIVYFYWTDLKSADGAITDDELTPLVFDDNKLLGWGWLFWGDTAQKLEIRLR